MAAIGLAEAARLTGRNQSTIHRAMKAGKLSFTKDEAGERRIDVAELERVFGIKVNPSDVTRGSNGANSGNDAGNRASHDRQGGELTALQRLLDDRERTIADLREAIRDYRARLDKSEDDRERVQAQLTGLLTGKPRAADDPRSWPRRVLRWLAKQHV